ncbi:phage minor head protein [Vibrio quintilis]|uniref:Phage Mu protein F like protein n=1 Tax=Vibrio quintilis TaxID=1117707 RepID=A0A1M7Z2A8_9VIBR|nr:phage minor head protein [Vibrio quintilis]SHO58786.1 Phage Mu protein F like protein [Vibrio quintilis]
MPVRYGSQPFDEQIQHFRNKTNIGTERWADIWKQAHDRAFMVAGAMKDDLLADFRRAVDTAISEGRSLGWFQSQFDDIVAKHGWQHTGAASWRAQVIYDTNIRQSYTAGREQQIEQIKHRRPYGLYKHSGSEHPRHDHLSWNNLVLPLDDPWWKTHTPINGYGCKCRKLTLSEQDLQRLGLKVGKAPEVDYYDWVDSLTGEVHRIPKGIDPGFDYTPQSSAALTEKTRKIIARKPPLNARLNPRIVDHAFSTVRGVNATELSRILTELDSPQVKAFEAVLKKHDLKTLFLKLTEISGGKKAYAIADDVEAYLQSGRHPLVNFTSRRPKRVNGFTASSFRHVVVKAKSTDKLAGVSTRQLTEAAERVIAEAGHYPSRDGRWWSFSAAAQQHSDAARVTATWAHEMGHQLYFLAGRPTLPGQPSLTEYGSTTIDEWFAEHFVAWLFAPDALKVSQPESFAFITDTVQKAL